MLNTLLGSILAFTIKDYIFDFCLAESDKNGLVLIFNGEKQAVLNNLKPYTVNGVSGCRMPNIQSFNQLGFGVIGWNKEEDLKSFPAEFKDKIIKSPIILISRKWLRESQSEVIILGHKNQTGLLKALFQHKKHWIKSSVLPGHYYIKLPQNIYNIKNFLNYI